MFLVPKKLGAAGLDYEHLRLPRRTPIGQATVYTSNGANPTLILTDDLTQSDNKTSAGKQPCSKSSKDSTVQLWATDIQIYRYGVSKIV